MPVGALTLFFFAKPMINKLKGQATMLFVTHQIPKGLQADEMFSLDFRHYATRMEWGRNE